MELNFEEYKVKKLFINILLKKGKKINSEIILKKILINIKKKTKQKPIFILMKCINNLLPKLKTIGLPKKKRFTKKKNKNLFFLMFLNLDKQIKTSINWLFLNSKLENIVNEIIQTSQNKGKTVNYKKEYYKDIKKLKFNLYF